MESEFILQVVGDRTPGPSSADHSDRSHFGEVPKISMHRRTPIHQESFDPVLVSIRSTIGSGRKCAISRRTPIHPPFNTPGPNYMPKSTSDEVPKYSFPKGRRVKKIPITPGPSDYYQQKEFGKDGLKISITQAKRKPLWDNNDSPGPAYKCNWEATRPSSPRYQIRNKIYTKPAQHSPRLMAQVSTISKIGYSFPRAGRTTIIQH